MKKRSKLKIVIIAIIAVLLLNIADWLFSVKIYKENFDVRFTTPEPAERLEDFKGLMAEKYEFTSDKGQKLIGYKYTAPYSSYLTQGIVVMAHGFGGGGHNSYIYAAEYFAQRGYIVFAYDATACDESEGSGVGGLPQGVIDLDHAISFVESSDDFPDLPIVLFGHSWGGYSVMSVLRYHPEVKAVAECSGFVNSSDMFEIEGKKQAGPAIYAMLPYVKLYDRYRFGEYSANGALEGLAASEAPVMVIHSADDDVVPIEYGYDKIYEQYAGDPRFRFIRYEDRGHNNVFNDKEKLEELNEEFRAWVNSRGYDTDAPENADRLKADKLEYMTNVIDHEKWHQRLDHELMNEIADFYEEQITKGPRYE